MGGFVEVAGVVGASAATMAWAVSGAGRRGRLLWLSLPAKQFSERRALAPAGFDEGFERSALALAGLDQFVERGHGFGVALIVGDALLLQGGGLLTAAVAVDGGALSGYFR